MLVFFGKIIELAGTFHVRFDPDAAPEVLPLRSGAQRLQGQPSGIRSSWDLPSEFMDISYP